MINKFRPGLLILPEDDAFRQIAQGFEACLPLRGVGCHVLPPADGWGKVVAKFESNHAARLKNHPKLRMVLLVDFDNAGDQRLQAVQACVPATLRDRVFVLGPRKEAEDLKKELGRAFFESVGERLADGCPEDRDGVWDGPQLAHNRPELERLRASVNPFLFQPVG